ncbi:lactoferrin/transferrin family TonB-dependent receptor [Actinobacillus equuli subsp. haemolyticus]|nr:lactoferrin/transferrin family TonB-dependent receptor [Actinobacillus equuli subsp. haemolyticus]
MRKFTLNLTYVAIQSALFILSTQAYAKQENVELGTVTVKAKKEAYRQQNEITGLGKITKNSKDLEKEQVQNIRELTRYDPGISVVEQGRGASSGYSIRGVDRNRVALLVDGLPQIQSYKSISPLAQGGAINEIEYENIRSIEFSKGASSQEYGSGALGGAVGFRTKNPDDVIKEGQNWGLDSKTAYVSKNKQFSESLSFAGRSGGFEALVQYTHRKGKETEIHKDATNVRQSFYRVVPKDLNLDKNQRDNWFVFQDECPTGQGSNPGCVPRPIVRGAKVVKDSTNAKDYTGDGRIPPNPMKYQSGSWLFKLAYHFSPKHSVNTVFEQTKQRYDIQDMTQEKYAGLERNSKGQLDPRKTEIAYSLFGRNFYPDDPTQAIGYGNTLNPSLVQSAYWSQARFFDERHTKRRLGVGYQYKSENDKGIFDRLNLNLDQQDIRLLTKVHNLNCSRYPYIDKNCKVTPDKRDSNANYERNIYKERHKQVQLSFEKDLEIGKTQHLFNLSMSYDRMRSNHKRDQFERTYLVYSKEDRSEHPYYDVGNRDKDVGYYNSGTYKYPRIIGKRQAIVVHNSYCKSDTDYEKRKDFTDCSAHITKGQHYAIGLSDRIFIGDKLDLGLGARYDYHRFKSDDDWIDAGKHKNFSWNTGLTVRPIEHIALSYRVSNGFRVPSFDEMFGRRVPGANDSKYWRRALLKKKLTSEKALNQEVGVAFNGDFGVLEVSYFDNRYRDLIVSAKEKGLDGIHGFYNLQSINLNGVNLLGKLNWHGIWSALPDGLYSNLAYNRIKVKNVDTKPNYVFVRSPVLDAIQPERYVASLGYDEPNGKWGMNYILTYSKAKKASELIGRTVPITPTM